MADLLALEKLCTVLPGRINDAASAMAVSATLEMARDVIDHTPVDITTAVSNWQVSLNEKPGFGFDAIYPGSHGSTAGESREAAYTHAQRVLAAKKPGEVIYLSNLAPYIEDLNNGTSKQEPAGMVERAIRVGERFAASHDLEIKL